MPGLVNWKRRAEATTHEGTIFEKLDLRSMKAFGSKWIGCSFVESQMDLADLRASRFERVLFTGASLRLVNFATSFFEDCLFVNCDLEQASFMGSRFRDGRFLDCRMPYGETMFQDATVKGRMILARCNLHGSNLDFREVEPKALSFEDCNLWGVKVGMACEFWNSSVDERTVKQFLALVARVAQDPRIAELAGDQYAVVMRAMDGRKGPCTPDTTTSRETTSSPTLSFPAQKVSTVNVMNLPTRMMETS
jgi:hypothetical protein